VDKYGFTSLSVFSDGHKMRVHTAHLDGHRSKYYSGPTLPNFGDQMGTGMSNVGRCRSFKQRLVNHLPRGGKDGREKRGVYTQHTTNKNNRTLLFNIFVFTVGKYVPWALGEVYVCQC
jgi:hypothetical protein